ncbi:HTH_Tnp_Tc3_2 domain-containing protein [Trichonephila clavipes]|nr:HTH_Tnp_Tc3_2 domain-containing protein [Trichonephila clavipes]
MGHSISEIVRQLRFSSSTVSRVYQEYMDGGQKTSDRANCKGYLTFTVRSFGSRRPTRVPLLNARHRVEHLARVRENRDWSVKDWQRVAWSNESRFRLLNANGMLRIWRQDHEAMDPEC